MSKQYELNEKDIDSALRYLKSIDPANATSEMAIKFLEELHANVHLLAHENPELLDKIYQDLKRKHTKN